MEQTTAGKYPFQIKIEEGQSISATRIVGNIEGKRLVVTAGVHGDEYVGIQAVREIMEELKPEKLAGQVIFVPVVNRDGFYEGTYLVPEDGENLNRCFPGNQKKSLTWRMAYALEQTLYPNADFLLDLHGGGSYESMEPLAFFPVDAGETIASFTRSAVQKLSLSYMVQSYAKDGLYSWAAQCGIPAILVERGGKGTWNREEVAACKENIYQIMNFLGLYPYSKQEKIPVEIQEAHYETAGTCGYWYCNKMPGASFTKEEIVGYLMNDEGQIQQEIRAPFDGVVLYHTNALGVKAGMPLVAYGKIQHGCATDK